MSQHLTCRSPHHPEGVSLGEMDDEHQAYISLVGPPKVHRPFHYNRGLQMWMVVLLSSIFNIVVFELCDKFGIFNRSLRNGLVRESPNSNR
ncbi:hypothetical protein NPIL_644561 [Nephila pilipes]|uniref:Uncharacterized protein n=1 Tax=Nephila pilipes TaxID=299642 RepID=A0A8X6PXS7_NEPPI|nr:hypothetical protein NPIL_644561 [Nephila pilipes]